MSFEPVNTSHTLINYVTAINPGVEKFEKYVSTISKLDLTASNDRGDHVMAISAFQGNSERVAYILNKLGGRDLLNRANDQGWTPLHYAACHHWKDEGNALETIKVLIEAGANVDAKTTEKTDWALDDDVPFKKGLTALQIAGEVGNLDVVEYILGI